MKMPPPLVAQTSLGEPHGRLPRRIEPAVDVIEEAQSASAFSRHQASRSRVVLIRRQYWQGKKHDMLHIIIGQHDRAGFLAYASMVGAFTMISTAAIMTFSSKMILWPI